MQLHGGVYSSLKKEEVSSVAVKYKTNRATKSMDKIQSDKMLQIFCTGINHQ